MADGRPCRPGDLAVVIAGSQAGLFVDVVRQGEAHPHFGWASWQCTVRSDCEVTLVDMRTGRPRGRRIVPAGFLVMFPDRELWPIRPSPPPIAAPAPPIARPRQLETTP